MAKYTNESWIKKAKEKYGERFSFENTLYIDSYHKVKVFCKEHDKEIEVDPISFIRPTTKGNVCPDCKPNKKLETKTFINRISENFEHISFEKTEYINYRNDVILTCKKHGEFKIKAKNALRPNAIEICPECIKENESLNTFDFISKYKNSKEGQEEGVFYKLLVTHKESGIQFLKIGISSKSTKQRYDSYKNNGFEFEVLEEIFDNNYNVSLMEQEYKIQNKDKRFYLPKDIEFKGRRECYAINEEIQLKHNQVKFIRESILNKQGNICTLCEKSIEMPTLDHYHSKKQHGTGNCRGVLCNTCNRMVGVIENNLVRNSIDLSDAPMFLLNLVNYIKNNREPYIHPTEKPRKPILMKSSYNKLVKLIDGKQKVPDYKSKRGNLTKPLMKLFEKYGLEPVFKKE